MIPSLCQLHKHCRLNSYGYFQENGCSSIIMPSTLLNIENPEFDIEINCGPYIDDTCQLYIACGSYIG